MQQRTAFITGGSGFIGSKLIHKLLRSNWRIITTGNKIEQKLDYLENLIVLEPCLIGIDWDRVKAEKIDCLFHLSANNDTLATDRDEVMRANVSDSAYVFSVAKDAGCKQFVYASSGAIYGKSPTPFKEDMVPETLNIYAESKIRMEKYAAVFACTNKFNVSGLRFSNVYGPGELHKGKRASMITQMAEMMNHGGPIRLFRDGRQRRDWIHVDDVVDACIKAAEFDGGHEVFNIASGESVDFLELRKILSEYFGHRNAGIEWIDNPQKTAYQDWTEYSTEKARLLLDFKAKLSVPDGIKQYLCTSYPPG